MYFVNKRNAKKETPISIVCQFHCKVRHTVDKLDMKRRHSRGEFELETY